MTEDGKRIDPPDDASGGRFDPVPHRLHYTARSDRGLVRANNQDSVFAGDRMMVVADGMGGHAAGDTASRLVVAAFAPLDERAPGPNLLAPLNAATREGNAAIADVVDQHPELDGMGTTVTALLFDGNRMGIAHVGDSRAYLYRSGVLHQLTHDDTFVQSLVDDGRITEEEASRHPQRNLLLRALNGTDLDPSLTLREVRAGDRYLICSDGLSGVVAPESVADALAEEDPARAADILIELALVAGGPDNVTVVVADVVDTGVVGTPRPVQTVSNDPDATGPIDGLHMTREMLRVPLPPIPEEPAAAPDFVGLDDADDDEPDDGSDLEGPVEDDEFDEVEGNGLGNGQPAAGRTGGSGSSSRSRAARRAVYPPARRWRRRGALTLAICVLIVVALGGAVLWTRSQYYVGAQAGQVTVFRGVNGSVLSLRLSSPQEDSCAGAAAGCVPITLDDLQPAARDQVLAGIQAGSLAEARQVMSRLAGQLLPPCPPVGSTAGNTVGSTAGSTVGTAPATTGPATTGLSTPGLTSEGPATNEPNAESATALTSDGAAAATGDGPRTALTTQAAGAEAPNVVGGQPRSLAAIGPAEIQGLAILATGTASSAAMSPLATGSPAANLSTVTSTEGSSQTSATGRGGASSAEQSQSATVTVTRTVSEPSGTPLAPLPAQPGITCRVVG